jgi:hypothetical protein
MVMTGAATLLYTQNYVTRGHQRPKEIAKTRYDRTLQYSNGKSIWQTIQQRFGKVAAPVLLVA